MLHAPLALDWRLESFVFHVMACARQSDSTLAMSKIAELDALNSPILSPTTPGALSHYNIVITLWRNVAVRLHDLITQTLL